MKVKISIDAQSILTFFLMLTGFAIALFLITRLQSTLTIIFVSFFFALALNPPVAKLASYMPKHSRVGATALSYLIVLILLGGFLVLAVPPLVDQTVKFVQQVPNYIDTISEQQEPARDFLARYNLESQLNTAIENARSRADDLAASIGSAFVSSATFAFNGIITVLTVLVLTFLMLIEGPLWMKRLWSIYVDEEKRDRHHSLVHKMYNLVTAFVNGQVLIAGISAASALVTVLILSTIFNVDTGIAIPIAGIVFLATMIPMVGATIGGAIVTVILLFNDFSAALIFLVYFIVYQQIENNVIQPVVQSRGLDLSALNVLVAVLIGISLAGILGGLVAIPIAGCIKILLTEYLENRQKRAAVRPENVLHKVKNAISLKTKEDSSAA